MAGGVVQRGGSRRSARRARRQMSDINVTPLVDVMLVLLIVFMITAPLLTTGVAVDLPRAESSPLPGQDEPLSVTVGPKGEVFVQDSAVPIQDLAARLGAISRNNPDARIFVRGDQAVDYGQVMRVVGAINRASSDCPATRVSAPVPTPASCSTRRISE